jgi:hypothetical protein
LMMGGTEQVRLVHEARENPAAWRVYVFEWVSVGWFESEAAAAALLQGLKAPQSELRVDDDVLGGFMVWAKRWNVDSEWKHEKAARTRLKEVRKTRAWGDCTVAARASVEEQELLSLG